MDSTAIITKLLEVIHEISLNQPQLREYEELLKKTIRASQLGVSTGFLDSRVDNKRRCIQTPLRAEEETQVDKNDAINKVEGVDDSSWLDGTNEEFHVPPTRRRYGKRGRYPKEGYINLQASRDASRWLDTSSISGSVSEDDDA